MSTVSKGTYYKNKTRKWFQDNGYFVALTEYKAAIPIKGKTIWVTRDLMGSDGIAMKKETNEFIFWNSKGVSTADSRNTHKSKGKKDFSIFPFPDCVKRQVIIWEMRAKQPIIVNC